MPRSTVACVVAYFRRTGVVSGRSGTTLRWNRQVQFLTPRPRLLHPQPPLRSRPTSLTSDSMSSQPVIPIIKSNPFISQSNPSVHPPSANIINALCHLSNTLGRPPIAPPVKVHVPDVLDGTDPHRLHHFLFQYRFYFCSGPAIFKSDKDKINFAMTYVSGMVQDWLQVALEQEDRGVYHAWLYSWSSFVKEMHTHFGIPDIATEAAHSLDHLRMNPDDRIAIYSGQKVLSAIGTILDSLIIFRISFPLVKEVNLPPSRLYIPQPSPSTIISGNGNVSPKGLHTPHRSVLYIQSALSLSLNCQYPTPVPILTPWSLLISIPLGNTLRLQTSLTLTVDCRCLSPILVL